MTTFTTDITVDAPAEAVWRVLADIGTISQWNPGVVRSHTTSEAESGLGATRYCDLGGDNYLNEEVVQYEAQRKLTMRITDTNMPFETADIHFTLHSENGQTLVAVSPEYALKYGPLGVILDHLYVRRSYRKGMHNLLQGLKEYVESGEPEMG